MMYLIDDIRSCMLEGGSSARLEATQSCGTANKEDVRYPDLNRSGPIAVDAFPSYRADFFGY